VGFVVDKVTLKQVSLQVLQSWPIMHPQSTLHKLSNSECH
jgi:hypothetical protein